MKGLVSQKVFGLLFNHCLSTYVITFEFIVFHLGRYSMCCLWKIFHQQLQTTKPKQKLNNSHDVHRSQAIVNQSPPAGSFRPKTATLLGKSFSFASQLITS